MNGLGLGVGSTLFSSGLAARLNSVYVIVVVTSGVLVGLFYVDTGLALGVRSLSYPICSITILACSSNVKPNFEFNGGGLGIVLVGREFFRVPRKPFDLRSISLIFLLPRALVFLGIKKLLFLYVKGGL